jgi:DNA modification methylase
VIEVKIKTVKLSEIKLNPDNPRTISKKDMALLIKSLKEFPDMLSIREIVVDENMTVLGGNMRLLALQKSGAKEATAKIVTGLTKAQKREFVIKDNASFGSWDMDALANAWGDLPLIDWGVDLPGDWLKTDNEPKDAEPQIDRAAELNKVWGVKTGDLWQIGEHRLLCGDSTRKEDVGRLMGEEKADMVLTDPPFGVNVIKGKSGKIGGKGLYEPKTYQAVIGDDKPFHPEFLLALGESVFIFGANNFSDGLPNSSHWLVWDKNHLAPTQDELTFGDGELIYTNIKNRISIKFYRHHWRGLVREGNRHDELKERVHPTQKPVGLLAEIVKDYSKEHQVIIDPFLGSGSLMVACQNLNRKCRGIEISPDYCAVILQRMTDAFPWIEIKKVK